MGRVRFPDRSSAITLTLAISIAISILLAENICLVFWIRTRPDRAVRLAEKEKASFLTAAALKILNRGFGVQGAPAMDDEFDEPEVPVITNRALQDLEPQEAQEKLDNMRSELEVQSVGKRSPGSIARRRELVGEIARYERHIEANPQRPDPGPVGGVPYVGTLEPDEMDHLSALREH
jgi:hypothetical protein